MTLITNTTTKHFTEANFNLLKILAQTISIPNIHIEIEDSENTGDTLIIEYSEFIIYTPDDKTYLTGHIVHFPGNYHEPPDNDYLDRGEHANFDQAAQDIIMHIATAKIDEALEFEYLSNLPPDPPEWPVSDLEEESYPMYGIVWKDGLE